MNLIFYPEKCNGCRICELMCTFHHGKVFGRKTSSIEVKRLERRGEFRIIIHESRKGPHLACNLCKDEDLPLCVKFCPTGAVTLEEM